ncbi:MAG: hypothetical protein ACKN89_09675 [Cyanobium sp.]
MSNYTLKIAFDDNGLDALTQAGQKVTIVKQSPNGGKPIAWISFQPQQSNSVDWTEQYAVYTSTTNIQSGAIITTNSQTNAIGGSSYTIGDAGHFLPGVPGVTDINSYEITNSDPNLAVNGVKMVTAGLIQTASVNGSPISAPLCATAILYNQTGVFTPRETIMVFTSSYADNGIIIDSVAGSSLKVEYTTNQTASIKYNDQTNTFVFA